MFWFFCADSRIEIGQPFLAVQYTTTVEGRGISPQYTVNANVNDGAFHHLALTYDGTNASVYCDGVLMDERAFAINTASGTANIGARIFPTEFFDGAVGDVRIYNRALSSAEIQAIYLAGTNGMCLPTPLMFTGPPIHPRINNSTC